MPPSNSHKPSEQKMKLLSAELWEAVRGNDLGQVKALVKRGADVNYQPIGGEPLSVAVSKGSQEMVAFLLTAGADPDGSGAIRPLMHAIFEGHTAIALLLLERGATTEYPDLNTSARELAEESNNRILIDALATRKPIAKKLKVFRIRQQEISKSQAKRLLETLCGTSSNEFDAIDGAITCRIASNCNFDLFAAHEEFLKCGYTLLGCEASRITHVALVKETDKFRIIEECGTCAPNYDLTSAQIIDWLRKIDTENRFFLIGVGHDFIRAKFQTSPKNATKLAKWIAKFCPDVIEQGVGTVSNTARKLTKDAEMLLWWD